MQTNLNGLSTVNEYKERLKHANRNHMVAYSELYLRLSKGNYEIRQQWVLNKSYELWYNTGGATYWSER